ncbi:hypothetical protein EC973_003047 [Apophysomyces ossiformis]|uniref:Uncharacterized protein n=1 Tax=Apophysomyces ossiformis TaxID=679940 RepID=A0A8H7BXN4_9FUNG|nr:hypothetical protein EC973_003047 [Apophysomyces ossiformis]
MTMSEACGVPADNDASELKDDAKATRKLRKKKLLPNDEVSDIEEAPPPPPTPPREDYDAVDDVDTDDLLEDADKVPPLRTVLKNKGRRGTKTSYKHKRRQQQQQQRAKKEKKKEKKVPVYDPEQVKQLSSIYPDDYWHFHADQDYCMIDAINEDNPLTLVPSNIEDQGAITGMTLSTDGTLLATFSNIGSIKIWDVEDDFRPLRKLRDTKEPHIDEFYCGKFVSSLMVAGGKLKDRHRWSAVDEDSHILPCPIKIFDLETTSIVSKLEGHAEEILCIKSLTFKEKNYYISTSQDGYIIKWHMEEDWTTLVQSTRMEDGITCMAFTVSFVPNTGNKYFLAACDGHLRIFDFEDAQLLQTFEDIYSSYCDCGKFVNWLDEATYFSEEMKDEIVVDEDYAWFISRGAEMCDISDGVSSIPNTCTLHKLSYPNQLGGQFKLEQVKKYQHEDYHSNSWLVKITSNGRYLLAPTIYGQVFVFNMLTGQATAVLKDHEDIEVRDTLFHPYRSLLFTSGDDGCVKVYTYKYLTNNMAEHDLVDVCM